MKPSAERTAELVARWTGPDRDGHLAEARLVRLPGNVPPWTDTGIVVRRGTAITLLASGRLVLSADLDLWYGPRLALWGRIGERGTIFNGTRDSHSLTAEGEGHLFLSLYNGEWATPQGDLRTPREAYATSGGGLDVLVLRWKAGAREGLEALAQIDPDDPLIAGELHRLRASPPTPQGWHHLWFLGDTEIFREIYEQGRRGIEVYAHADAGILQTRVDLPLSAQTTLDWRWRVDDLPATVAEDGPLTHDYVSLAVEFDNGRDLTWYWSAGLPIGRHYACPLPTWTARETHWVVRSGADGLGEWFEESRPIADDYRTAIGAPPARIVGVWLIAVALFRRGRAQATFTDIRLRDGARVKQVL